MMSTAPRWRVPAPRVRVATALLYRQVCDPVRAAGKAVRNPEAVSEACFRQHLELLRQRHCTVSTIRDLSQANQKRARPAATGRAVVLTFDGSYASHADPVLALLWERRMPGEFFINPAFVGRRDKLSWSEIRGMASAGMSIQSQGLSEYRLDRLSDRDLFDQLARSKATIEDRTGYRVTVLAAPHGDVDDRVARNAFALGYRVICSGAPGYWFPADDERLVPRLPVRPSTTDATVSAWLDNNAFAVTTERLRQFALRLFLPGRQVAQDNNNHRKQGEI